MIRRVLKNVTKFEKEICLFSIYLCTIMPGVLQYLQAATEIVPLNLIRIIPAKGGNSKYVATGASWQTLRANPNIQKN
jgi:hypothetical protein